jgi:hypothetical protein
MPTALMGAASADIAATLIAADANIVNIIVRIVVSSFERHNAPSATRARR